ncbi:PREDICTED: armadillo repeat protein deleted in velo-cardio-facial syndrome-like, partial [Tinamus guttatus]|uniref:armadillo repeat protein deleted in velo-cardio-facial syndrome-like n=1 Tax=Tinamus guttatus TaxID=94827 RepID=UPI00052F08AD
MDDYDIRSAASILASVKEQEARFERLARALEGRNVSLQLERANQPAERMSICNIGNGQPLATAWQQLVLQMKDLACTSDSHVH